MQMTPELQIHLDAYNEKTGLLEDLVTGLVESNYINTILICGSPGVGKSTSINALLEARQECEENPIRYVKYSGHVTPRALFEKLKENASSDSVLVFDDSDSILNNDDSMNLLKAASEKTARRKINWVSSLYNSDSFIFEGKIIIITNIILEDNPHLNAVADRFHLFNLSISYEQKMAKIFDIANKEKDNKKRAINAKVIEFLMKNHQRIDNKKLSLRLFMKLTEIAALLPDKWERFIEVSGTYLEDLDKKLANIDAPVKRKYTKKQKMFS